MLLKKKRIALNLKKRLRLNKKTKELKRRLNMKTLELKVSGLTLVDPSEHTAKEKFKNSPLKDGVLNVAQDSSVVGALLFMAGNRAKVKDIINSGFDVGKIISNIRCTRKNVYLGESGVSESLSDQKPKVEAVKVGFYDMASWEDLPDYIQVLEPAFLKVFNTKNTMEIYERLALVDDSKTPLKIKLREAINDYGVLNYLKLLNEIKEIIESSKSRDVFEKFYRALAQPTALDKSKKTISELVSDFKKMTDEDKLSKSFDVSYFAIKKEKVLSPTRLYLLKEILNLLNEREDILNLVKQRKINNFFTDSIKDWSPSLYRKSGPKDYIKYDSTILVDVSDDFYKNLIEFGSRTARWGRGSVEIVSFDSLDNTKIDPTIDLKKEKIISRLFCWYVASGRREIHSILFKYFYGEIKSLSQIDEKFAKNLEEKLPKTFTKKGEAWKDVKDSLSFYSEVIANDVKSDLLKIINNKEKLLSEKGEEKSLCKKINNIVDFKNFDLELIKALSEGL